MKATLLLATAFLTAGALAEDPVLVFDAKDPHRRITGPKEARYRSNVLVRVIGANTFVYNYSVKGQTFDYHTASVPGPLGDLVLTGKPTIDEAVAGVLNFQTPQPPIGLSQAQLDRLKKAKSDFQKALDKYAERLTELNGAFAADPTTALAGKLELDAQLDEIVYQAEKDNVEINEDVRDAVRTALGAGGASTDPTKLVDEQLVGPLRKHRREVVEASDDLDQAYREVVQAGVRLIGAGTENNAPSAAQVTTTLKPLDAAQAQAHASVATTLGNLKAALDKALRAAEYVTVVQAAADDAKDGIVLGPIRVGGDETEILVAVAPTEEYLKRAKRPGGRTLETKTYTRALHVYGRPVLDFSAGPVLTGLQDRSFYKDAGGIVRSGVRDRDDFQFGVFAHWYRTARRGAPAFAPTIGLGLDDDNPRILLGGSLVYDASVRLTLTVGVARGNVTKLNGMVVGDAITGDVSTRDVARYAPFVGLSLAFYAR